MSRVAKKVNKKTDATTVGKKKAAPRKSTKKKAAVDKPAKAAGAKKAVSAKRKLAGSTREAVSRGAKRVVKERAVTPTATTQDPIQFPEEHRPLPKTRLTDAELAEFQQLLLIKRAEIVGDLGSLEDEALKNRGGGNGDHSPMPIHMADLGSDNWEQEFTLGLVANERALVLEINEALERIEDRTYGICLGTRKRITKARLRAKPWAKYCIEYARAREEGRAI